MIVTKVPYRLSIAGGGTDLPAFYEKHGASLITASISKYMYVFVSRPAANDKIQLYHHAKETVNICDIDKIEHAIIRESLKFMKIDFALEVGSMCDVQSSSGLGSSSVFTVGLLAGLHALKREYVSPEQLAEEACHVEIDLVGKPIGKQDQYAAAIGGINELIIDKSGKVTVNRLDLNSEFIRELENRLLMFYTGSTRDANVILAEQSEKIKLEKSANESMQAIALIGKHIETALAMGDIDEFGALLHAHWLAKKTISDKMSNPKIDSVYTSALRYGAIGGKLIGAGGSGFLLFCTKEDKQSRYELITTMEASGLKFMDFRFEFEGVKVLTNI
jgi:D-glycero-alpha-D-manno-heptose-7-phosphate kinase